jgi:hypothetical protein
MKQVFHRKRPSSFVLFLQIVLWLFSTLKKAWPLPWSSILCVVSDRIFSFPSTRDATDLLPGEKGVEAVLVFRLLTVPLFPLEDGQ